jgi:hypothetical protein
MAINVKDTAASATKFVQRAQAAAPDYQKGVQGAGGHWQAQASAANETYVAGVTAAANAGRYRSGVQNKAAKYEANAAGKGAQRYPQGVAQAGPSWQAGFSPYAATLQSLTLPPRRPKGDPSNYQIAQAVGDALHKKKMGI